MKHYYVLEQIVNDNHVKRMAELGVYKGYLARHILRKCRHVREYYAIDQWRVVKGEEYGRYARKPQSEWDEYYTRVCREIPYYRAMKVIKMPALEAVKLFPLPQFKGFFDLVYVDTSHFYQETHDEVKAYLPLVREGGIMGGHDYAATRPEHQGVKKAVDEIFGADNVIQGEDMVWYVKVQ